MARLLHEVWIDADGLPGVCLAGPLGQEFKRLLGEGAKLAHTFVAGSHVEAMRTYHELMGWEPYTTDFPETDAAPYPEDWLHTQIAAGLWRGE